MQASSNDSIFRGIDTKGDEYSPAACLMLRKLAGNSSPATAGERKLGFGEWACAISFPFYLHWVSHEHGAVKKKRLS